MKKKVDCNHNYSLKDGETLNVNAGYMRDDDFYRFTILFCNKCGTKKIHKTHLI